MKYLYKILRLFFCPHKYDYFVTSREDRIKKSWFHIRPDEIIETIKIEKQIYRCKYCGKVKLVMV